MLTKRKSHIYKKKTLICKKKTLIWKKNPYLQKKKTLIKQGSNKTRVDWKIWVLRLCRLGCVTFCLRTGALFFSFKGSKGATSAPCEWLFSTAPELGFRWCLAVSDPLPKGCRFAFVQARLRHVFCLRTGALFFSIGGSKGAVSGPQTVKGIYWKLEWHTEN